jgi:O-antigen/teichoic acid export membrane protein
MFYKTVVGALNTPHRWWRDELLSRLLKNAATLIGGNFAASVLALISFSLAARGLGPANFGLLMLVSTYAVIMTRLFAFQPWQVLIRYGGSVLESKQRAAFADLIKLGFLLDLTAALIATVIAWFGADFAGWCLDWSAEVVGMARLYSLAIATSVIGTPTAVLRLFNRFRLLALHSVLCAAVKALLIAVAFAVEADLWVYLLIWAGTQMLSNLALLLIGFWEAVRQEVVDVVDVVGGSIRAPLRRHPGLLTFFVTSNLDGVVRAAREIDVPIVAMILSVEAVGLYKVARQFASVLVRAVDPFYEAIYPELTKLVAMNRWAGFWRILRRSSLIVGSGGMLALGVFMAVGFCAALDSCDAGSWQIQRGFYCSLALGDRISIRDSSLDPPFRSHG